MSIKYNGIYTKSYYDFEDVQELVKDYMIEQNVNLYKFNIDNFSNENSMDYKFFEASSYIITCIIFRDIEREDDECRGDNAFHAYVRSTTQNFFEENGQEKLFYTEED